jgi:hypothetical protein
VPFTNVLYATTSEMDDPPMHSLALAVLQDEFDEDRAILDRPQYAQVRHLLRPGVLSFVGALCKHCIRDTGGDAISKYLSALSGVENGAVFRDLCGAASIAFLTSHPALCDRFDQVQLYHFLRFCEWPPHPHTRVTLAHIPPNGYFEARGSFGFAHAVIEMRYHPKTALCELVLGHDLACNSMHLCDLILRPDFSPKFSSPWSDALEEVLSLSRAPNFRVKTHTTSMIIVASMHRVQDKSTPNWPNDFARLAYGLVQRILSNSAMQYLSDKDLWYANAVRCGFVDTGPSFASFRSDISCMLMSALGRDVHKVVLDGLTCPAVLLAGNQTWKSAAAWSKMFKALVDRLVAYHGVEGIGRGWVDDWTRHIAAFKLRCKSCVKLPGAPLDIDDWVPFESAVL